MSVFTILPRFCHSWSPRSGLLYLLGVAVAWVFGKDPEG